MKFLSLFSGIGGLDLGLEWAGWKCAAMCEADAWCRALLAERFPNVPLFDDVTTLDVQGLHFDAVVGGFPCQDISSAGKGAGIEGERSGLWKEMHRVIDTVRPRWVIAENVPALRTRGADRVLGDLEGNGYSCWPLVVGAVDLGAPLRRKRVFILARLADAHSDAVRQQRRPAGLDPEPEGLTAPSSPKVADTDDVGRRKQGHSSIKPDISDRASRQFPPGPEELATWRLVLEVHPELAPAQAKSIVRRMDDGLSERMGGRWRRAALRGLGNAVVPQVGELIGQTINGFEKQYGKLGAA